MLIIKDIDIFLWLYSHFHNFFKKKKKLLILYWIKNLPAIAGDSGDRGLILVLGRYPGEGTGNPLQYSCLENSMN